MISNFSNEAFTKSALTFSLITMVLMASFVTVFAPAPNVSGMAGELDDLTAAYRGMTGASGTSEEIWGLTGIYTPYGVGADGSPSTARGTTLDGWTFGARVTDYSPVQYQGLNGDASAYSVAYDRDKGMYYYVQHGSDWLDISDGTPSTPSDGSTYTRVHMDATQKSDIFFSSGTKTEMDNGTFYYDFTGYRYAFQPLRDYYIERSVSVSHTSTSLSLIWYQYFTDSGLSGQLVLSGSDGGVAYITTQQIMEKINAANNTARFEMAFNGATMHIYIHMDDYAMTHGYTVGDAYNAGFWDVMVTSPSVTSADSEGVTIGSFDVSNLMDTVVGLLTFDHSKFGLTGTGATLASVVFSISFYTSLIAIGLACWPVLLLAAAIAAFQAFTVSGIHLWRRRGNLAGGGNPPPAYARFLDSDFIDVHGLLIMAYKSYPMLAVAAVLLLASVAVLADGASAEDAGPVVIFDANGGIGGPGELTLDEGASSYAIPADVPERAGYAFLGWALTPSATSADYYQGKVVPVPEDGSVTTYYAVWRAIPGEQPGDAAMELAYKLIPTLIAVGLLLGATYAIWRSRNE